MPVAHRPVPLFLPCHRPLASIVERQCTYCISGAFLVAQASNFLFHVLLMRFHIARLSSLILNKAIRGSALGGSV